MGSNNILILNQEGRLVEPKAVVEVGEGPVGLALDESRHRLYVLNRFSNSISVIDTEKLAVVETVKMFDPTPAIINKGRTHFYNTHETSGLGQVSCASCHVDGRFDRLAWDLGAPEGAIQPVNTTNRNFARFPPAAGERHDFHPMKGPMVTQTLQDIIGHEPFHWRGDRDGIEQFNGTFTNLQAAASSLTTNQMSEFKGFLASIHFPPNPYRTFSNTLPAAISLRSFTALGHRELPAGTALQNGSPTQGRDRFGLPGQAGCIHCHTLPTGLGPHMNFVTNRGRWMDLPLGTNGERSVALIGVRRSGLLPFKIPSLRNIPDKLGMTLQKKISRSGFGFTHDGSVDSPVRFLQDSLELQSDFETGNMIAFLLCLNGSELPQGLLSDRERPIGLESQDAHAAVGKQTTIIDSVRDRLLRDMYAIVQPGTSRVDVIVKGFMEGVPRGWVYDRTTRKFISDRLNETIAPTDLESLATPTNPLTFTVVARNTGMRLGIDRDEDGFPDRTEVEANADPANPKSVPIQLLGFSAASDSLDFSWNSLPGMKYGIEFKDHLEDSRWTDFGLEIFAEGLVTQVRVPHSHGHSQRYYRIKDRE
jgi:YVTN family beta-propeller protein